MIDVNMILLFAIILAPTGSDPMFQSLPPSCPIDVIPRNSAPRPTPNRRGPARSMGFTATGGVVVEYGAGKSTITGMISGIAIRRTTSLRRVAERSSRLSRATDRLLSPNHRSLLIPEREPELEKCSDGGAIIQNRARRRSAMYVKTKKNPRLRSE